MVLISSSGFAMAAAQIQPNPTSAILTVSIEGNNIEDLTAELFDVFGKSLMKIEVLNKQTIINIQTLPTGIYLLKVSSKNNLTSEVLKIVKN